MMKPLLVYLGLILFASMIPLVSKGQGIAQEMQSMHTVLEQLYAEIMPLCSTLIGVAQGIAGFAATWYIGSRVWRHIANAEPVDFYPLLRPFVIGFCIALFPSVISLINGVMNPVVSASSAMVKDSNRAIEVLLEKKEEAIRQTDSWQMYVGDTGEGNRDKWYKYTHGEDPSSEGMLDEIGNDIKFAMAKASYNFRNSVKEWLSEVLQILFEAAALCINTLRTFQLVVLSILGPLVFGIAVFDGFQHTLTVWIARYINIFLWLPVANIFGGILGKIQENMLKLDLSQLADQGDTFFSRTDLAYLVFLIIGIVGYFSVPSVANYIVHAGGSSVLGQKVGSLISKSSQVVLSGGAAAGGMVIDALGSAHNKMTQDLSGSSQSDPYFPHERKGDSYMDDKLKGQ
ncbi:conjugative transposon protein TraJ [Sphingobacterium mizutaii]|uniref:conjugative transposon protein TraJ n=1 Tax=Sphingobacterium mizutaii TaxID=1010 RepID=UPI001F3323B1|nr:conjugative transposon protein TraJ [Sphingobacterium mizutaii]